MNLGVVANSSLKMENQRLLRKINKWALKLIGVAKTEVTHEDLLEIIAQYVHSTTIQAFFFDSFNNFYTLFLNDIESFCRLVGKKASMTTHTVKFLPLLDTYVVYNVYPFTTDEDLAETFDRFGHVFHVTNYHILPNSSKFSHVLSGKREISFTLPGEEHELLIPVNVFHHPYKYHVRKLCSACVTEGHSVLNCPDIEDDLKHDSLKSENSSDGEQDNVPKIEFRSEQEQQNLTNSLSVIKDEVEEPDTWKSNVPLLTTSEIMLAHSPVSDSMPTLPTTPPQVLGRSMIIPEPDNSNNTSEAHCSRSTPKAVRNYDSSNFMEGLLRKRKSMNKAQNIEIVNVATVDSVDYLKNGSETDTLKHSHKKDAVFNIINQYSSKRKLKKNLNTHTSPNNRTEEESDEEFNDLKTKRRFTRSTPASASSSMCNVFRNNSFFK